MLVVNMFTRPFDNWLLAAHFEMPQHTKLHCQQKQGTKPNSGVLLIFMYSLVTKITRFFFFVNEGQWQWILTDDKIPYLICCNFN